MYIIPHFLIFLISYTFGFCPYISLICIAPTSSRFISCTIGKKNQIHFHLNYLFFYYFNHIPYIHLFINRSLYSLSNLGLFHFSDITIKSESFFMSYETTHSLLQNVLHLLSSHEHNNKINMTANMVIIEPFKTFIILF